MQVAKILALLGALVSVDALSIERAVPIALLSDTGFELPDVHKYWTWRGFGGVKVMLEEYPAGSGNHAIHMGPINFDERAAVLYGQIHNATAHKSYNMEFKFLYQHDWNEAIEWDVYFLAPDAYCPSGDCKIFGVHNAQYPNTVKRGVWNTYTAVLTAPNVTTKTNGQFTLEIGPNTGNVYIDNVTLSGPI